MSIEVVPKGNRVLVEKKETRTLGGIELPQNTTEPGFNRFVVVALGDPLLLKSGERIDINVEVGDEVLFMASGCAPVGPPHFFDNRELAIVEVDAILAVFKGEMSQPLPKILRAVPKLKELVH